MQRTCNVFMAVAWLSGSALVPINLLYSGPG